MPPLRGNKPCDPAPDTFPLKRKYLAMRSSTSPAQRWGGTSASLLLRQLCRDVGGLGSDSLGTEQVALAPTSEDQRRVEALVNLVAQVADVHVHDIGMSVLLSGVEVL